MLTLHYCRQSFGFFTHWNRDLGSSMFYHFFLFSTPIKTVGFVPQCLLQKNRLVFRCRDIHVHVWWWNRFRAVCYHKMNLWHYDIVTIIPDILLILLWFFFWFTNPLQTVFFSSPCICFIIMLMPVLGYFWE